MKKAGLFLGIGMDNVIKIPTNYRGQVLTEKLNQQIEEDKAAVRTSIFILYNSINDNLFIKIVWYTYKNITKTHIFHNTVGPTFKNMQYSYKIL